MTPKVAFPHCAPATRDREVIQIDFANDKLGIAQSLRQAFAAASHDESSHDFEALISELH